MMKFALNLGTVFVLGFVLASSNFQDAHASEQGRTLYDKNCASCHGKNLEGEANWKEPNADGTLKAPPHDVTGHTWHHPDSLLFHYTKFGGADTLAKMGVKDVKSGMPAFGEQLTDAEIWGIFDYIKTYWPEKPAQHQRQISEKEKK